MSDMSKELEELEKPIGEFIQNNASGTILQGGGYYHYTDVCRLLKTYSQQESKEGLLKFLTWYMGDKHSELPEGMEEIVNIYLSK